MDDSRLIRLQVLESFQALSQSLQHLRSVLSAEADYPAWVALTADEQAAQVDARHKALDLYCALWYVDGQDGRDTLSCPGVLGASTKAIRAALECNQAKDQFKAAILALKRLAKPQALVLLDELQQRQADVAWSLRRIGAARLNLKQAYRHIPTLSECPHKIGFTWSRQGRTIQRTTVEQARELLERRANNDVQQGELRKLAEVPEEEMLARVRSVCPHVRANLLFKRDQHSERRLIQAPLPILVPLAAGQPLPEFVATGTEPSGQQRQPRSDVRIEEQAFLPSIRVHRYHPRYR